MKAIKSVLSDPFVKHKCDSRPSEKSLFHAQLKLLQYLFSLIKAVFIIIPILPSTYRAGQ